MRLVICMNSYMCLLFYDIPKESNNMKLYRKLRKELLFQGFYQIQESVYAYKHQDKGKCYRILEQVQQMEFNRANVKALIITQNVFDQMLTLHGVETITEKMLDTTTFIVEI